jgi:hypothetical protein
VILSYDAAPLCFVRWRPLLNDEGLKFDPPAWKKIGQALRSGALKSLKELNFSSKSP